MIIVSKVFLPTLIGCCFLEIGKGTCARDETKLANYLQNGLVILPLLFLFRQECSEAGILSKVIQIGIPLEQRVARESVLGRRLQPLDCLLGFIHERISTRDVVGSMMKVTKSFSLFYGRLDLILRHAFLPG